MGVQQTRGAPEQPLEPFFELGGPAYRLMQRIEIIKGIGPSIGGWTIAFIAVTWFRLLVFAGLERYAIGPTPCASLAAGFCDLRPLLHCRSADLRGRERGGATGMCRGFVVRPVRDRRTGGPPGISGGRGSAGDPFRAGCAVRRVVPHDQKRSKAVGAHGSLILGCQAKAKFSTFIV